MIKFSTPSLQSPEATASGGQVNSQLSRFAARRATLKGFSLIELLVVIAILGVLSAFLFGQFGGARERARDAQRKVDIRRIQTALEAFYQDNDEYPAVAVGCCERIDTVLDVLVTDGYIAELPRDPSDINGNDSYARYYYDNGHDNGVGVVNCFGRGTQTYRLWAWLENDDDAQATDSCGAHTERWNQNNNGDLRFVFTVRSP